jgi:hypothetical protein
LGVLVAWYRSRVALVLATVIGLVLSAHPAGATPAEARTALVPSDLFDRLRIATATLADATATLGPPRQQDGAKVYFSVAGYDVTVTQSVNARSGFAPGTVLGLEVAVEKPRRPREWGAVSLNGYWTPKSCVGESCKFDFGGSVPLHLARLRDLGLTRGCTPISAANGTAVRWSCAGSKASNFVDVDVVADLKFGLEGDLVAKAGRAGLMLRIREMENDPNNPDRGGATALRQQSGLRGPITNESIWTLVQDLPVASYELANRLAILRQQ